MGQAILFVMAYVRRSLTLLGKPLYYLFTYTFVLLLAFFTLVLNLGTRLFRLLPQHPPHLKKLSSHFPSIPPLPKFHLSRLALSILVPVTVLLCSGLFLYVYIFKDLPHPKNLITQKPPLTTKIFDRNHQLLYKVYSDENRSLISLVDLPPHVIQATLSIEDAEFYDHAGFSLKGIMRAFRKNVTQDKLQGGSTITQQLVKNTLLTPERTLRRKVKELVLALLVENYFTKDEILTMYFNEVPYGGPTYGIEEAAQYYFKKSARSLTLGEAALLAGLPAAPTIYSPYGSQPESAFIRQHEVLRRMVEEGYITLETADQAKNQNITFAAPKSDIKAPHFVMYVKDILARTYGEQTVTQGGLDVITSLDLDIQEMAQAVVADELQKLKKLHITNAAALVTKPRTGEILAMVGSGDYFDTTHDGQVNVTLRPRQPGSSIKPVTYSLALKNGFTAASIIEDAPITYRLVGSPPYTPQNYDSRYHGKVTFRQALANSYNIPAVKILSQLGVKNLVDYGSRMGITTWNDSSRFGLSLTLGAGEVKMVDLAVAYGVLANYGHRVDLHPIRSVVDINQKSLELFDCDTPSLANLITPVSAANLNPACTGEPILDSGIAYIMTHILSDNQARSQAFGLTSVLHIPGYQVAVKTGTTNNLRDNWTIGYTPDYLVAVWVGNNDNSPMSYVASGITGASPIWARIMTSLLKNTATITSYIEPPDIVKAHICPLTGSLACGACPNAREEVFLKGTEPTIGCSDEQIARILNPSPTPPDTNQNPPRDQILEGIVDRLPDNFSIRRDKPLKPEKPKRN